MSLLDSPNKRFAVASILLVVSIVLFALNRVYQIPYQKNEGPIYGTTYHLTYQSKDDLHDTIKQELRRLDKSLSIFNKESTISKINSGDSITNDSTFLFILNQSQSISELTEGAFDITVAPLVNAWGFGTNQSLNADTAIAIDSILQFVGFEKLHVSGKKVTKDDQRLRLDLSAIAKGYACDCVAELLEQKGVENYLVEIGGEIVAKGNNDRGGKWRIGIDKPTDGVSQQAIQEIIEGDMATATSGNYRQYYYQEGQKRTHTIDPRTGYPTNQHTLSATIIARKCFTADALATAAMVLEPQKTIEIINSIDDIECYIIHTNQENQIMISKSDNFDKYILK
ncbi:MAG: FAD:protein FMN transferase [Paludibacteraceae bacterium]|nr:FAD:protein FMN transferase [Paludibacteraceae bacterium]